MDSGNINQLPHREKLQKPDKFQMKVHSTSPLTVIVRGGGYRGNVMGFLTTGFKLMYSNPHVYPQSNKSKWDLISGLEHWCSF